MFDCIVYYTGGNRTCIDIDYSNSIIWWEDFPPYNKVGGTVDTQGGITYTAY